MKEGRFLCQMDSKGLQWSLFANFYGPGLYNTPFLKILTAVVFSNFNNTSKRVYIWV